ALHRSLRSPPAWWLCFFCPCSSVADLAAHQIARVADLVVINEEEPELILTGEFLKIKNRWRAGSRSCVAHGRVRRRPSLHLRARRQLQHRYLRCRALTFRIRRRAIYALGRRYAALRTGSLAPYRMILRRLRPGHVVDLAGWPQILC